MTVTLIVISGWLLMPLGALHLFFPRYFNWKNDLKPLSLINRQLMEVHTFFLGLTVCLLGLLCASSADALTSTSLGRRICFGMALFWGARLLVQFFWYSSALWRGKLFETVVHVVFSMLWTSLTVLYGIAIWQNQ